MFGYKFAKHTKEEYIKVMLEYRVKPCQDKGCPQNCFNYHNESERRRPPVFLSTRASECPETKDKANVRYDQNGWRTCSRGDDCPYFHTLSEWFHPASYKRRKHDETTSCYVTTHIDRDPIYCSYLHDEDDPEVIREAREEALQILKDREDKREKKIVSEQRKEKRKRKLEREEEEKREWAMLDALQKSENEFDDDDDDNSSSIVTDDYSTSKSPSLANNQDRKSKRDRKKERKAKKSGNNGNNNGGSTPSEPTTPTNVPIQVTPIRETQPKVVDQITTKGNQSKRAKTPKSPTITPSESSTTESNHKRSTSTTTTNNSQPKTTQNKSAPASSSSLTSSAPSKLQPTKDKSSLQGSNSSNLTKSLPEESTTSTVNTSDNVNEYETTKESKPSSVYDEYEEKEVGLPFVINPVNVSRHKGVIISITPSWVQIKVSQEIYFILGTSCIWGLPADWQERKTLRCGIEVLLDSELQRDLKSGHIASYGCLLLPTQPSPSPSSSLPMRFLKSRPPFVTLSDAHNILNEHQLNKISVNLTSKDMLQTTTAPPPMYTFELFDQSTIRDLKLKCALRLNKPIGSISIAQLSNVISPLLDNQDVRSLQMGYSFQGLGGCDTSLNLCLGHQEMHDKVCSPEEWKSVVMEIGYICYSEYWGIYFECLNYYLSSIVDMSIERKWMFDEGRKTFVDTWLQSPITFESIFLVFTPKPNGLMSINYELSDRSNRKDVFAGNMNSVIKESVMKIEEVEDENCVYSSEYEDFMPAYLPPDTMLVCDIPLLSDRIFINTKSCEDYKKWLTESTKLTQKLFSRNKNIAVPSYNPQTGQVVFYLPLYEVPSIGNLPSQPPSSSLTTQPKVLYVAEAQKVISYFDNNGNDGDDDCCSDDCTLLVVHSVVSPIIAYMNTRIAGSNMPQWLIHAIGMGRPDPMQEVAIGMRKYAMQRKVIDKGSSQDIGLLLRESFDYIERIGAKTVPTYDYQSMMESFQAARSIISGRGAYNFNIQLDAVCFVCGKGAHYAFRVAKSAKKNGGGGKVKNNELCLLPYIKCEHCGNCIRAYKVMPIRVNLINH